MIGGLRRDGGGPHTIRAENMGNSQILPAAESWGLSDNDRMHWGIMVTIKLTRFLSEVLLLKVLADSSGVITMLVQRVTTGKGPVDVAGAGGSERTSQISSLLFEHLLFAHHSARRLIHAFLLSSGSSERRLMQNLKSSIFCLHSDTAPYLYSDLSCAPGV